MNYLDLDSTNKSNLLLSFPYNPYLVDIIKKLPIRKFCPEKNNSWSIPYSFQTLSYIQDFFQPLTISPQLKASIKDYNKELKLRNDRVLESRVPKDVVFVTKPFKHQVIGFNFIRKLRYAGIFFEMGLGKTKVIIDLIHHLKRLKQIKRILIVCPKSVCYNWHREIIQHSNINYSDITILDGSKWHRINLLNQAIAAPFNICIINYEGLVVLKEELLKYKWDMMVCDESTRIKSPSSKRSKLAWKIGLNAERRYILTGSPVTQDYTDLFSQLRFVDQKIFGPSFIEFINRYAIRGGFQNHEIIGFHNIPELREKVNSCSLRYIKEECLDLPKKIYMVREFDLSDEQLKTYSKLAEELMTMLQGKEIVASKAILKLIRFSQISSGFLGYNDENETPQVHFFKDNPKLETLSDILQEEVPKDEKIIIWCRFIAEITLIEKLCKDLKISCVTFYGATPDKQRQKNIDDFNSPSGPRIFIGQIRTGGIGINLTAASYCIYFSNSYSLEDRLQSEDRAHRIGQTKNVTYIDLIGRKTVDSSILKALKKKSNLADQITQDSLKKLLGGDI